MSAPLDPKTIIHYFQELPDVDQYTTNEECPSCLEPLEGQGKWGHIATAPGTEGVAAFFHSHCGSCLKKWFDLQKREHRPLTCPMCNIEIHGEDKIDNVILTVMAKFQQNMQQPCAQLPFDLGPQTLTDLLGVERGLQVVHDFLREVIRDLRDGGAV